MKETSKKILFFNPLKISMEYWRKFLEENINLEVNVIGISQIASATDILAHNTFDIIIIQINSGNLEEIPHLIDVFCQGLASRNNCATPVIASITPSKDYKKHEKLCFDAGFNVCISSNKEQKILNEINKIFLLRS